MIPQPVLKWLRGIDTGISSKAIVAVMEGVPPEVLNGGWGLKHPLDPADFGRCLRLLAIWPDYRPRLHEMAAVSPQWRVLVNHWDELEALYNEEAPSRKCPNLYDRMQELLDGSAS